MAGEVESLTAATQRGIGVRAWLGDRVGYAYGTDPSDPGLAAIAAGAAEAARVADEDEFTAPPQPMQVDFAGGARDPSVAAWTTDRVAELALSVERAALAADPRIAGVETAVYADSAEQCRDLLLHRDQRRVMSPPAPMPTCRRWPRVRAAVRAASASVSPEAPRGSTRRRSGPRVPSAPRR